MSRRDDVYSRGCDTCHEAGQQGYCAPLRCYCAHPACPAYASYVPLADQPVRVPKPGNNKQHAKSWAERDEPTWLDR